MIEFSNKMIDKKAIIILGAPGAGKGTQANLLAERFGLEHIETSKILEKAFKERSGSIEIDGKKYSFEKEIEIWKNGELCSPPLVVHLLQDKIKELAKDQKSIIFSGSPRTLFEAEKIMPLLEALFGRKNISIFFLKLGVEGSVFRNSHRRICELMRHPVVWHDETENLKHCPLDGSKLLKRALDKPEIIEERYKVFERRTLPIVERIKEYGYNITKIDAAPSVADIFQELLSHL